MEYNDYKLQPSLDDDVFTFERVKLLPKKRIAELIPESHPSFLGGRVCVQVAKVE